MQRDSLRGFEHALGEPSITQQKRMEKVGFTPDDPLLKLTAKARDAVQELAMAVHYAGCKGQVGDKD
jgi:hypothetical protein